ncbi:MAG: MBL fold metallo-hydrolase [Bacteroidota bacterium]
MKIGAYEVHALETGRFALDGGAMFGIVPKPLWAKTNPPDERNRIELAMRVLLLVGNGKTILVDVGIGRKFNDKLLDIYKLDHSRTSLESSLKRRAVSPSDVTDVILTHLHFDHAGGSTVRIDDKNRPAFPNATYYVQKAHWDLALHPTEKDRGSFMELDYLPLQESGVLEFVEEEIEIFPGIELFLCHGHTDAQQLPKISDGQTTVFYCCDLIPTASHLPLPYIMSYDLRPLQTLEEKKRFVSRACEENWILFFEHDPVIEAARIGRTDKGFVLKERLTLD